MYAFKRKRENHNFTPFTSASINSKYIIKFRLNQFDETHCLNNVITVYLPVYNTLYITLNLNGKLIPASILKYICQKVKIK